MYKKGRVNSNRPIISTDEDPSLRIESSAIINLCGVSTKLNKYIVFTMQTYKKLITEKTIVEMLSFSSLCSYFKLGWLGCLKFNLHIEHTAKA